MRYVVVLFLLSGVAAADDNDLLEPNLVDPKPTVHEVTAEDRKAILNRCSMIRAYLTNHDDEELRSITDDSMRRTFLANRATVAKQLTQCLSECEADIENLRTEGTPAEREQREWLARREAAARAEAESAATEQAARKAAATEQRLRDDATRRNVKAMGVVFGAQICMQITARAAALKEIATEKYYSRIGGYENKVKIYELQNQIRAADEALARIRADLRSYKGKVKPATCSERAVRETLACYASDDACNDMTKQLASFLSPDDDE
jgi:hypothetical protein